MATVTAAEEGFLMFSGAYTIAAFLFVFYQCIRNFTKLRLACLLSILAVLMICIGNFYWAQGSVNMISEKMYWVAFAMVRDIYTTLLVACMLDMGRIFYEKERWNTALFKITILQLIVYDGVNIADVVLIFIQDRNLSYFPLFLCQLILGVTTITSSFLYAFLPVLSLHLNHNSTTIIKTRNNINAQSAAVGTWYMSITGILSIGYLTLYLVAFVFMDELTFSPIGNAFDVILRTSISLSIALPPPSKLIHVMKLKIVGRSKTSTFVTTKDSRQS